MKRITPVRMRITAGKQRGNERKGEEKKNFSIPTASQGCFKLRATAVLKSTD